MTEFHEDADLLPDEVKEYHRIIQSVIEELEAVNWYNQRAAATTDEKVRAILEHNRDEEIEHAAMGLEWLRRNSEAWDEELETYLFTEGDITELEEEEEGNGDASLGIG